MWQSSHFICPTGHYDDITDIFLLPGEQLVSVGSDSVILWQVIFDSPFSAVNELLRAFFDQTNDTDQKLLMTTNGVDRIYVIDSNKIIVMNKLLCCLKEQILDDVTDAFPSGLYFHKYFLYVCYQQSNQILIYDEDLDLNLTFSFNESLTRILAMTEHIAFVKDEIENKCYIYDLPDWSINSSLNISFHELSKIGNFVYDISTNQVIYLYNSRGELCNTIDISTPYIRFYNFKKLFYLKDRILIFSDYHFSEIKIKNDNLVSGHESQ